MKEKNDNEINKEFPHLTYYSEFNSIYASGDYKRILKFREVVDESCNNETFLKELKEFITNEEIEDNNFIIIAQQVMTILLYKKQIKERTRITLFSIIISILFCFFVFYYESIQTNITNIENHLLNHELYIQNLNETIYNINQTLNTISSINQATIKKLETLILNHELYIQNLNKTVKNINKNLDSISVINQMTIKRIENHILNQELYNQNLNETIKYINQNMDSISEDITNINQSTIKKIENLTSKQELDIQNLNKLVENINKNLDSISNLNQVTIKKMEYNKDVENLINTVEYNNETQDIVSYNTTLNIEQIINQISKQKLDIQNLNKKVILIQQIISNINQTTPINVEKLNLNPEIMYQGINIIYLYSLVYVS